MPIPHPSHFLDELDVRVSFEKARISNDLDLESEARFEAERLGMMAFVENLPRRAIPLLLGSVRELRKSWIGGWDNALEMSEMNTCPFCQNGTGNPCPVHD